MTEPKLLALMSSILGQFLNSLLKIVGGTPVPGWVWVSKSWSYSNTRKNLKSQQALELKYGLPTKLTLGWVGRSETNKLLG